MTLLLSLLLACADDPAKGRAPSEDFQSSESVRVLTPTNGETVTSPFVLTFEAGEDVRSVYLRSGSNMVVTSTTVTDGAGELIVTLAPGRHSLELYAEGARGGILSFHDLVVRVAAPEESWVTITSPTDGTTRATPVGFTFEASDNVETIELTVDGVLVGTTEPDRLYSVPLAATGDEQHAVARGYDLAGAFVGEDEIDFTPIDGTSPDASSMNDRVTARLATYPTDGSYGYYWPADGDWYGTTQDIEYLGEVVAEGDPEHRSYCVGLTFEVMMLSFLEVDAETGGDGWLNGVSVADLDDLRVDWFVRDLWGDGPGVALDNYGLGERVTDLEMVEPGDFIQFWRHSGSGHNAIFVGWERDPEDDAIIGVRYWSTQGSTDGVDYNEEFFGSSGSRIDPGYFYASRMWMPEDWAPWR
ncbi:MAG: hypothetical protein Q8P41_17570 [Pseudomonadota bacterium]|nr:hypothetical protein [Pseudomonadota bacterium]